MNDRPGKKGGHFYFSQKIGLLQFICYNKNLSFCDTLLPGGYFFALREISHSDPALGVDSIEYLFEIYLTPGRTGSRLFYGP
jgi:hypothetical protein